MPQKKIFLFSGILFFFFFIFFSYLVHKDLFTSLDFNTTVRLQDNIPRRFDRIFSLLSDIGKFEISLIVLIAIFAFSRKIVAGLASVFLFGMFHFIELFGKFFVNHPPPPEFLLRTERIIFFPQFHVRSEFSYPSGHAGRAAFISLILIAMILKTKRLKPIVKFVFIAVITCYNAAMFVSRIYLGEHWTSDVLGGAILGAALGFISSGFLNLKVKHLLK